MFLMVEVSYLLQMLGVLEEHPGRGYWFSFTQRLPISFDVGDCLYGLMNLGWLLHNKEDTEGELMGDAVEEEVL